MRNLADTKVTAYVMVSIWNLRITAMTYFDDDDYLLDVSDLFRRGGVHGYVHKTIKKAVNKAAAEAYKEARRFALEEAQRILDGFEATAESAVQHTNKIGITMSLDDWIGLERDLIRKRLRPQPTEEEKRAQNRERVRRWRATDPEARKRAQEEREFDMELRVRIIEQLNPKGYALAVEKAAAADPAPPRKPGRPRRV